MLSEGDTLPGMAEAMRRAGVRGVNAAYYYIDDPALQIAQVAYDGLRRSVR
jgi:hypothetical protein